jgi:hypothetical protein
MFLTNKLSLALTLVASTNYIIFRNIDFLKLKNQIKKPIKEN